MPRKSPSPADLFTAYCLDLIEQDQWGESTSPEDCVDDLANKADVRDPMPLLRGALELAIAAVMDEYGRYHGASRVQRLLKFP